MAVAITIVGQGTVQQVAASYDETYSPDGGLSNYRYNGTVYTLTATPAAGWRFKRWYQPHHQATQDGAFTHTFYPLAANPRSAGGETTTNPLGSNLTTPLTANYGADRCLLFEGDYDQTFSDSSSTHYAISNLAVTAEFELAPVGPGPILRSDAGVILRSDAGVILHQG